jgi:hypothetical protein
MTATPLVFENHQKPLVFDDFLGVAMIAGFL